MKLVSTKPFPVIGMSPGNSYFSQETILWLLEKVTRDHGKPVTFIPDVPARANYEALGYETAKAIKKARLQGNLLRNRFTRACQELGQTIRIIDWATEVEADRRYQVYYQKVLQLYTCNEGFRLAVRTATDQVLLGSGRDLQDLEQSTDIAVHYLISELAFLEWLPDYLGVGSILYLYHKPWPVYQRFIAGDFDATFRQRLHFCLLKKP